MTLVLGIATPKGIVLGSDGLTSWGPAGAPTFQTPTTKLFAIGTCFAVGVAGAKHLDLLLAQALQSCPLGQAASTAFTKEAATTSARDAIKAAITTYVQHIAFNQARPLTEQIGSADLLLVGLCSDGPLLIGLDQTANWYPPATPHYYAVGSGALPALLLLRAYSKYSYADHPLQTSVLLTKRVLDMVAASVPEIGGQVSIMAIFSTPEAGGQHLVQVDLTAEEIQDGMTTWELLEEEMFTGLATAIVPPPPPPPPAPTKRLRVVPNIKVQNNDADRSIMLMLGDQVPELAAALLGEDARTLAAALIQHAKALEQAAPRTNTPTEEAT